MTDLCPASFTLMALKRSISVRMSARSTSMTSQKYSHSLHSKQNWTGGGMGSVGEGGGWDTISREAGAFSIMVSTSKRNLLISSFVLVLTFTRSWTPCSSALEVLSARRRLVRIASLSCTCIAWLASQDNFNSRMASLHNVSRRRSEVAWRPPLSPDLPQGSTGRY